MSGNTIAVLSGVGSLVVAVIALLVVRVDERSALARIWGWMQRGRKEHEALKQRVSELEKQVSLITVVAQNESKYLDTKHEELALLVAALKKRVDAYGKQITDMTSTNVHNAEELDALGTKQKQVEAQLVDYARMLLESREQIGDLLRLVDDKLDTATTQTYRILDDRLKALELRGLIGEE